MDGQPDFYTLLGVAPQAEPEVIRAAYRVLAQRYHPDRLGQVDPTAATRMAALNQAYDVLSCPERRHAYDRWCRVRGDRLQPTGQGTRSPRAIQPTPPQVLTTYDRRGRLHAFI